MNIVSSRSYEKALQIKILTSVFLYKPHNNTYFYLSVLRHSLKKILMGREPFILSHSVVMMKLHKVVCNDFNSMNLKL